MSFKGDCHQFIDEPVFLDLLVTDLTDLTSMQRAGAFLIMIGELLEISSAARVCDTGPDSSNCRLLVELIVQC